MMLALVQTYWSGMFLNLSVHFRIIQQVDLMQHQQNFIQDPGE